MIIKKTRVIKNIKQKIEESNNFYKYTQKEIIQIKKDV